MSLPFQKKSPRSQPLPSPLWLLPPRGRHRPPPRWSLDPGDVGPKGLTPQVAEVLMGFFPNGNPFVLERLPGYIYYIYIYLWVKVCLGFLDLHPVSSIQDAICGKYEGLGSDSLPKHRNGDWDPGRGADPMYIYTYILIKIYTAYICKCVCVWESCSNS